MEFEQLDRRLAMNWLEEGQFRQHLALPERFRALNGASYWPFGPERFVRHWMNRSAREISVRLAGKPEEWNLGAPDVRRQLMAWKVTDDCQVNIVLETQDLPVVIKEELALLARFGIRIVHHQAVANEDILPLVQLITAEGKAATLLTDSPHAGIPGMSWLKAHDASTWVTSEQLPAWDLSPVDTDGWLGLYESATVLEVTRELNGPIAELSGRFKALLTDKAPTFMTRLQSESVVSIHYEDRYLRSPWAVMLLMSFMQIIPSDAVEAVSVDVIAAPDTGVSTRLWDNWTRQEDMHEVLTQWLSAILNAETEVKISTSLAEVSHRRVLTLTLASGKKLKLAFDQGMGYWQCHAMTYGVKRFDFNLPVEGQVKKMLESWRSVSLINSGDWPTDIALYEVS